MHEKTEGGKLTACSGRCAVHLKHTEHDVIVLLHPLFSLSYNFKRNCEIVYFSIYINKINKYPREKVEKELQSIQIVGANKSYINLS